MRLSYREAAIFPEPERLLQQLDAPEFVSAFGRGVHVFEPLEPVEPDDVGRMVWDLLAATKFAPGALRLACRGEVIQPQQRMVRGKAFIDPQKLMEGLQFEQTLNMMGVEKLRADIRAVTTGLEERFDVPCPANLYVSYEGSSGGYGPHRDQHDVVVVHLAGEKVWKIYPPLTDRVSIRKVDVTGAELEQEPIAVTMTSGSCLYVPAGFAHHVVSRDGCCVHLTFGIQCLRWHDVLSGIMGSAEDNVLFERMPTDEEEYLAVFEERIVPRLARVFSRDAVSRMMERYQYFGSLTRQQSRVVRSIAAPSKSTDR